MAGPGVNSKGTTGGGTSVSTTGVATQTTGSVIALYVVTADATAVTIATDSKGNSYTAVPAATGLFAGPNKKIWAFYKENAAGGSAHTTTANVSPADAITLEMQELLGCLTSGALDSISAYANDLATAFTATTGTPAQADWIAVAGFSGNDGTNTASTEGSGMTKTAEEQNGGAFYDLAIAVEVRSTTATKTTSWTRTGSNDTGVSIMGFKVAAGGAAASGGAQRILLTLNKGPGVQRFRQATRGFANPATDATAALTGLSMSISAGTLIPSLSIALSGQAMAAALGTMIPAPSIPLSGSALASALGTLTPANAVPLVGSALASALGTLAPTLSIPLTGLLITIGQGTLSAPGNVTAALTGIALTASLGTLVPNNSIALSGSALAMNLGIILPSATKALTGLALAMSLGTLVPGVAKAMSGQALTSALGTIGPSFSVTMTGSVITASAGTLTAVNPSMIVGAVDNTRIVRVTVRMDLRVASPDSATLRVKPPRTTIH